MTRRQDGWTADEDLLLAEITLRHIREGSTQLAAFEEVARRIGRTAAACGFRWNSYLRKKYQVAIQLAKSQRKRDLSGNGPKKTVQPAEEIGLSDVIRYLQGLHEKMVFHQNLEKEYEVLKECYETLKKEHETLKREYQQLMEEMRELKEATEDVQKLGEIMKRARELNLLEEPYNGAVTFVMESNGNLERMKT
ncbi:MAG: hypothetical protein BAA01_13270 [Bacillus thermozeamaize]|uniref:Uncharacterized protein n=1 Tax=Bacillus thermozeamaize TaxID=230954 RepID=A0A1Y3PK97_9BACI|nr:MAG: hypothetical protein BAA01_13270 [Bacillus thermozeamaize]